MAGNNPDNLEIEVKIKIENVAGLREKILTSGFKQIHPRLFEYNVVYDTPDKTLKKKKNLLRLRKIGDDIVLTYKRPAFSSDAPGTVDSAEKKYKIREELEVTISDFETMETIFNGLGYRPLFIYEKYREEFQRGNVKIMLDETPIGTYMEIEGRAQEIDDVAAALGYWTGDYITANYRTLFKKAKGKGHMRFSPGHK